MIQVSTFYDFHLVGFHFNGYLPFCPFFNSSNIGALIHKEVGNDDVDPSKVAMLVSFGFKEEISKRALKA